MNEQAVLTPGDPTTVMQTPARPDPSRPLRMLFSVGVLLFALFLGLKRRTSWTVPLGGDPWSIGEWLINYRGGFVRRGLFGELFLMFGPTGEAGLWTLIVIQSALWLVIFGYSLHALHRANYAWSTIAVVCSPAAACFIAWGHSPDQGFHKELLAFVVLAILAWARQTGRARITSVALVVGGLLLYTLAMFSWEASAFVLPAILYLLLRPGAAHPELVVFRRSAAAVFTVLAGVVALVSTLRHGDATTAAAVCQAVMDHGFRREICGEVAMTGGAIEAIGWTSYKTTMDVIVAWPLYVGYLFFIPLALLPYLVSAWFRQTLSRWLVVFSVVCVAPLFFIVTDYGRWIFILATSLMFCMTSDRPQQDCHSRLWGPLGAILYVSLWGLPHWLSPLTGVGGWPRLGLVATVAEELGKPPTIPEPPDGSTLDFARRFLSGAPSNGTDSWRPMQQALEYIQAGGTNLYQDLFFSGGVKFQYAPTSLFFIEPAHRFSPTFVPGIMNVISWFCVLVTAALVFAIIHHLWSRSPDRAPLTNANRALLAIGSLTGTLLFYPVVKAWDLGQAQTLINMLAAAALYALLRGKNGLAGLAIGLVCLLKPQLALFLLWALIRRDWRFFSTLTATGTIGVALSIQRYGLSNHLGYVDVLSFLSRHGASYYPNQSVNGTLHRFFQTANSIKWEPSGFPPYDARVYLGSVIAMAIFVGLALIVTARPANEPEIVALDFSIAVACFTMSSQIAWEHHYGVLMGAYALTFSLIVLRLRGRTRVAMMVVTVLSWLLASQYWPLTTRLVDTRANVLMSYLLIGGTSFVAVRVVLRRQLTRAVPASAPTAEVPVRSMAEVAEPARQGDSQPPRRPARALPEPDVAVDAPAQDSGQTSSA